MNKFTYLLIFLSATALSCGSAAPNIFGSKTPHEKYEAKLKDTGVSGTPEGRLWLAAAEKAIAFAQPVSIPHKLHGYFDAEKPRALGLSFQAKQGELISFDLGNHGTTVLYADLFKMNGAGAEHILSAESGSRVFEHFVKEAGTYVLRLQPEINTAVKYDLGISSGPSFAFPVTGSKARVGSFWGDSRDGGKRSHEGIDIFAPKKTPVVAIADGYISAVRNGGLGGKTVNLRPSGTNYSLYYAHLDEQLVTEGQYVRKGDVIGTVGNTGNARTTPPHLHFGIYSYGGAVDPFPFVNREVKKLPAVPVRELQGSQLLVVKPTKNMAPLTPRSVLVPIAVTAKGYIAEDADGNQFLTPFNTVKTARNSSADFKG